MSFVITIRFVVDKLPNFILLALLVYNFWHTFEFFIHLSFWNEVALSITHVIMCRNIKMAGKYAKYINKITLNVNKITLLLNFTFLHVKGLYAEYLLLCHSVMNTNEWNWGC